MKLLAPDENFDELNTTDEASFWRTHRHEDLECLSATFRTHVFPPHTHETYVIGTVLSGRNVYNISGTKVTAGPGQLCFVNPGEVHDAVPQDGGYTYRMIYPRVSLIKAIIEQATGKPAGTPQFNGPVIQDERLAQRFLRAHSALETGVDALGADEALTSVLLDMVDRYAGGLRAAGIGAREPLAVRRAKDYLADHVEEQVELEALARAAGLSPFHLIRVFRKATGMTPYNWLIDHRVHLACNLLRGGMSATHAAAQCGFFDQSHLTRAFKSRLGVTPGQFRQIRASA
jgi:AraC-like DNA-binding protein/mannose-6-phosphate isomerase-like protein (cupin superfamily)